MLALTDSELACSRSPPPRSHRRNADDGSSRLPTARRRSSTAAERPPRRALPSAFALAAVPGKSRLDRSARVSAVNPFANIGASVQPSRSDGSRFGLVRGPHVRRTATSRHARRRWQRSRKSWRRSSSKIGKSASLIGHSGSSAFRLSTTAVSMSLAGSRFSPHSAPRPFHHGFRRRGGTIFRATLPSM